MAARHWPAGSYFAFVPQLNQCSLRCRFGTTFLGSRAVAGALLSNGLLGARDKGGRSLSDVLSMHGFDASPDAIARIAVPPERIRG